MLIIFDRLFGTCADERSDRSISYGLIHPIKSHNPLTIAFHEWGRLFQNLQGAKTWGDRPSLITILSPVWAYCNTPFLALSPNHKTFSANPT
ncbi:hypothetical protein VB711_15045 [Cronbergia sp. UHCC 0137]|uniref:hypothetical protein n=1 Tax=Cronbergia sp. UHCC 0137 TaxID=3110239 RepID=UPI002B21D32B|nr:hypothetical protein [Cronbergia sp. UHCC 0137]MEA5619144.1 hypothetical protein [Cronbergia sp. UHCC 0137]